jgi:ABC-2 type transport system permease protein
MNPVITIAKKEYLDAIKNKLFLILALFLIVLTVISIIVASFDFQSKVADYNISVQILKNVGKVAEIPPIPEFYPLTMLRGVIDYLEIIGAIIGIILGYLSVAKEKGKNILQLILSRPLKRSAIISGKIVGNSLLLLTVLLIVEIFIYFITWSLGKVMFLPAEFLKLSLTLFLSYLYILFFYCLSSALSISIKSLPNALIIIFAIWLIIVLIIPQIGDTMDPDNQIPGGFFQSMHIAKPQEKEILAKFSTYETTRNALEESSVTKHYERASFALLGITPGYNGKNTGLIFHDEWKNIAWQLGYLITALLFQYVVLSKNNFILGGD